MTVKQTVLVIVGVLTVAAVTDVPVVAQEKAYALVLARTDGSLGPNLRRATEECRPAEQAQVGTVTSSRDAGPCNLRRDINRFSANGQPWTTFVGLLGSHAGRIKIEDRTGLSGFWDFDVTYTPIPMLGHTNENFNRVDPNGPTIFVAVEQQLGLRLVPIN